ncbi:uncharacterized protein LOC143255479 [Tachypleus tridentatus]|uniref:uncharacterized protein LOC143255479 n=1 Tax=Tachypleus tridentatus TaxID=6853 RepID=UPI003FD1436F
MSTEDCSHSSNEPTTVMSAPMHVNQAPNNHGRASRVLVVDNVSQLSKVCSEAEVSSMTSHPPPTFSIPCEKDSNCDKELVSRASFLSLGSTVLPVSGQLAAAGDSTSSSINDLSFEAEQLERAIRHNDISFVRRMLELHHSRFPVDLHGSILDKSSCESHSRCVSQDVEILLRKSQTLLDRLDRQDSLSLEQDSPPVFASALHLAVECKSFDVARLLLKYGLDPNVRGPLVGSSNIWRHGSCSSTTDEGIEFSCTKGRRLSHFLSPGASRFLLNWSPSVYNENSNSRFSPSKRLLSIRPTLSSAQTTVFLGKDGASVTYEEVFTRDYLYNLPPLFLAVAVGFPSIVHLLLRFGATVNYQEQNGVSPLHLAVIKDRVPWHCVRILLECGAKVTLENKQGFSPRDLTEFDLSNLQSSLVDSALSCFISDASTLQQTINCEEPTLLGSHLRSNLLKRFHSTEKSHGRHHLKRAEFLSEEGKTRVSPGGDSSSSYHGSFRSFHSNRSISSVVGIPHEDEKMYSAVYEKDFHTETVEGTFRPGRRQSKEESRNKKLLSSNSLGEVSESTDSRAEIAVQTLTKMASNPECLSSVLTGLQIQIPAVVEMAEKVTGGLLHKPVSELLTQVLLTAVNQYREDQDQPIRKRQEQLILYLCLILRVAVSCLRGGQSLQFTALLTINKVVDVCILYGVLLHKVPARSKNSRSLVKSLHSSSFKENSSHSSRITQQHEESIPKGFLLENKNIHDAEAKKESLGKEGVQAMRRWPNSWKTPQKEPPSKGSPETENPSDKPPEENSVLGILNYEGIDLLLNVLNNAITLYKRVVGTRLQCTPSRRWRHCSYHCLQIMSARILLYMCQSEEVQERLTEDGHLKILIASLDSTNDPQLLCLVLQVIGTLALHPRYHMVLLGTGDLADCLTQLVLPSDEWYYTNHSTKYARYVKHHAGRILVYLGLEQRLRSKVYLFDIFEDPEPPPTPLQDRVEDSFIVMTSLAPSSVRDDNHQYIGMRLESVVRDMFKHIENKIVSEEYGNEQKLNSCEGDKDRRLVFLLESLPAVVHPVILLRLCQHRVLGSILYSSWRRASSRSSVGSRENRSRASSAGTEEGLRARRKVNLTIDCSSTSLSPSRLDVARRESVQSNLTGPRLLKREPICMMLTNHGDTDRDNPIPSPAQRKRSFHFSSLKRKRSKVQAQSASCSASQSDTHDTSEADIMAFQRELQNLPNFDLELSPPTSREKLTSEVISPRPRSCSVPRVTLHLPSYDAHGPLIRSATMEGTYSSGYDNVSGSGSHVQYENTSSSGSIPLTHSAVFRLLQMWATLTKLDFSHNPVMSRELRDFLARLSYLGEYYRWWAEEFRKLVDLKDGDDENEEEDDTSVINVEYHK